MFHLNLNKINPGNIVQNTKSKINRANLSLKKLSCDIFEKRNEFKIDPKTKKQILYPELFFIDVKGYGKNKIWGKTMANACEKTSELVLNKENFGNVVNKFIQETEEIQNKNLGMYQNYGVLRNAVMDGYGNDTKQLMTPLYGNKYEFFANKLKNAGNGKLRYSKKSQEFPLALTTRVEFMQGEYKDLSRLTHPSGCDNLLYAQEVYTKLIKTKNPSEKQINDSIAKIHWLLAQNTPWLRGSDSIANGIAKSIYRAYNMKLTPVKKGVSIDFEAFSRDMEDFVQKYTSFYQTKPKKFHTTHLKHF